MLMMLGQEWVYMRAKNDAVREQDSKVMHICSNIQGVTLRLKPFHLWGFQLIALIINLSAGFVVLSRKTETLLRATPHHSAVSTGFQREAGRATLEKLQIFWGFTVFYS